LQFACSIQIAATQGFRKLNGGNNVPPLWRNCYEGKCVIGGMILRCIVLLNGCGQQSGETSTTTATETDQTTTATDTAIQNAGWKPALRPLRLPKAEL
jgi:hypothetical protein